MIQSAKGQTEPPPYQIPPFVYNLTMKPTTERQALCAANKAYCTSTCGGDEKQAPRNFCNVTTLGWGCGCLQHIPNFEAQEWPINYADCSGRGQACQAVCQSDRVSNVDKGACNTACASTYFSKCGTKDQPASANYVVEDISITPSYGPISKNGTNSTVDNNDNKSGNSTTTKHSAAAPIGIAHSVGSAISILTIVVLGLTII
ncbi:hypothetical protein G9A89_012575 [Geosiphon pyriformis]|nr:hypothetical protein G9A89_012575 [Geosiphon pyriformis]